MPTGLAPAGIRLDRKNNYLIPRHCVPGGIVGNYPDFCYRYCLRNLSFEVDV